MSQLSQALLNQICHQRSSVNDIQDFPLEHKHNCIYQKMKYPSNKFQAENCHNRYRFSIFKDINCMTYHFWSKCRRNDVHPFFWIRYQSFKRDFLQILFERIWKGLVTSRRCLICLIIRWNANPSL
jgi:hypothetical protein